MSNKKLVKSIYPSARCVKFKPSSFTKVMGEYNIVHYPDGNPRYSRRESLGSGFSYKEAWADVAHNIMEDVQNVLES